MRTGVRVGGQWLGSHFDVSSIKHSTIFRREGWSGCYQASCTFAAPADFEAAWFLEGKPFEVIRGGVVLWAGEVSEKRPGDAWSINAFGTGAQAENFDSVTGAVGSYAATAIPNTGIDAAIVDGWNVTRVDSFGASAVADVAGDVMTVAKLADRAAAALGQRWGVDKQRMLELLDEPTTPQFTVSPGDAYLGTVDEEYVTHLRGFYVSSVDVDGNPDGWDWVEASDDDAALAFGGPRYRRVDLTPLGLMLSATAQANIDARFAMVGARTGWTDPIILTTQNVRRLGFGWADPDMVDAGHMLSVPGVMDSRSNPTTRGAIHVVGAEVEHDVDAGTSTFIPLGFVPRDFSGALAAAQPKQEVEVA